jgi:hypothetical protein
MQPHLISAVFNLEDGGSRSLLMLVVLNKIAWCEYSEDKYLKLYFSETLKSYKAVFF